MPKTILARRKSKSSKVMLAMLPTPSAWREALTLSAWFTLSSMTSGMFLAILSIN